MTEQRFACTACGKCCCGVLPLTIADALDNAHRFPLAIAWTPLRSTNKSYDLALRLGVSVQLAARQKLAVLVGAVAYLPPAFACPALRHDNLCGIQESKPLRCRAMPFYPYREEADQQAQLAPRKGWLCDTSAAAPVVYRDRTIVDRADFDKERAQLLAEAPECRTYAQAMLSRNPVIAQMVAKAAANPVAGQAFTSFTPFLRRARPDALAAFAARQLPVLQGYAARTESAAALRPFHDFYVSAAQELRYIVAEQERA